MNVNDLKLQAKRFLTILQPVLRHHTFIVTILSLGFLMFVVYGVSGVLQQPSDAAYRTQKEQGSTQTIFDQAAIKSINDLRSRNEASGNLTFDVARNRINPFTE